MLALALGKTLQQIGEMTPAELTAWREFYVRWPFDDMHRYHRPAALVASSFGEGPLMDRITARLKWLAPEPVAQDIPGSEHFSEADLRTMAAFGMVPPKG